MGKHHKTNKVLEFEGILKRISEGELEPIHFNGNSAAWKIFNKIRYVNEPTKYVDYAQCKSCKVLRTHTPENGTSALKKHKCKNSKENEIIYKTVSPDDADEIKSNLLQKSLKLCATDIISVDTVSGTGFINFAQALVDIGDRHGNVNIDGMLPKKALLTHHIRNLKDDEELKLIQNFEDARKNKLCSLSMSSHATINGNSQLIVNLIYFDNDLTKLTKKILFTMSVNTSDEGYSTEKMMCDIQNKFKGFGCDEQTLKTMCVVTPLKGIFDKTFDKFCSRMDCVAFIITSFLKPFIDSDEISEIFLCCKEIINFLIETGKDAKLKFKIGENNDSWEQKICMIQKLNLNYNEVMNLLTEEKKQELKFDQKLAEELVTVFEVFVNALDDLQSAKYPTINKILLWWSMLKDHFNTQMKFSRPIKRAMVQAKCLFEKYFIPSLDQKISCFLDPRFRFLKMLSTEDRVEVIREVRYILDRLPFDQCNVPTRLPAAPPAKKSKFSHLEANDDDFEERDEVNIYIHSTQLGPYNLDECEFNIISKFWKENQFKLPKLFRLAVSKLHIPACCCGRETAINLDKSIEPNTFNQLLFIRDTF